MPINENGEKMGSNVWEVFCTPCKPAFWSKQVSSCCEPALTGFMIHFPFSIPKWIIPRIHFISGCFTCYRHQGLLCLPWVLMLAWSTTPAGPQLSANREGDREGDIPGHFSLLFAFFPQCVNAFQEKAKREENRAAWVRPVMVPGQPCAFRWARAGFARAERGAEVMPCLGSARAPAENTASFLVVPGCRSRTRAHSLDLQLNLKDQSQKLVRVRRGHIFHYHLFFPVDVCSLAASRIFNRNLWIIFKRWLLKDWLSF